MRRSQIVLLLGFCGRRAPLSVDGSASGQARCISLGFQAALRRIFHSRSLLPIASTGPDSLVNSRRPINAMKPGTVYFVSTPLGNLGDITLRALDVLQGVDLIASEDTRTTGLLLKTLGLQKKPQLSHYQHNLRGRIPQLVAKARDERLSIAVVSEAGTPGISDPGAELAAACWEAGVPLVPVPGACAAIAAVSVAGFLSPEFTFYGFLPVKPESLRRRKLDEVARSKRPCVLYESANRIAKTLREIIEQDVSAECEMVSATAQVQGKRLVVCARELTKMHEELFRGTLEEVLAHYAEGGKGTSKGEMTLVIGPAVQLAEDRDTLIERVRWRIAELMNEGISRSEAVKRTAKEGAGMSKSEVYRIALEMKNGRVDPTIAEP